MMGITWEQNIYTLISADLGLHPKLRWSTTPPDGRCGTKTIRAHEETLQTLMSLYLAEVCDETVQLVGMAGDYWGDADIVGFDRLGRIHLLELKRGRIGLAAVKQLSNYLLCQVFVDPVQYVRARWKRTGNHELQRQGFAETLAGMLAGQQTTTVGHIFVQKWGLAQDVPKRTWKKWEPVERHPFVLKALLKKAETRMDGVPTPEDIYELVQTWQRRLRPQASPPAGLFLCERPVVVWLVGTGFVREAEQEIQRWRAAGVDARCLQAEVRFSSRRDGLILRVRRESAPQRIELLRRLQDWGATNRASSHLTVCSHRQDTSGS
jgi:hypothetical protein